MHWHQLGDDEKNIVVQLNDQGYVIIPHALQPSLVSTLCRALEVWEKRHLSTLYAHKKQDGTLPRLIALHQEVPEIAALFMHPHCIRLQHLFFGYQSSLFTSITFLQGSQQPLHRDIPIFNITKPSVYFRLFIALEPLTPENGALFGVPGSHRVFHNVWDTKRTFYSTEHEIAAIDQAKWNRYQCQLNDGYTQAGLKEVPFYLNAGDILLWHPLFAHGGMPVTKAHESRKSIVLHFSNHQR